MTRIIIAALTVLTTVTTNVTACPGSPASVRAKCETTVSFPDASCSTVGEEIIGRGSHQSGWKDPHNGGTYHTTPTNKMMMGGRKSMTISGSRLTGNQKYTDRFDFVLTDTERGGCQMTACSESQVLSVVDFSTNYCNLRMLYCNKADGCNVLKHDLDYDEKFAFGKCSQRDKNKCLTKVDDEVSS